LAKNRKKAIASSNDDGKDMVYDDQPFAASAKGLNKPLAFFLERD
jgi:hypothetical protein